MTAYQMVWGDHRLTLGPRTLVMGIVNVTPDSFSDGGRFLACDDAIAQGLRLMDEGADILDIGGESTRPFSDAVSTEEELGRVIPVIEALARRGTIPISIDTTKAEVARQALEAGASIINDVSALRVDPAMAGVAVTYDVPIILMHMLGTPKTMQVDPEYDDVVDAVSPFCARRSKGRFRPASMPDASLSIPASASVKRSGTICSCCTTCRRCRR
jgi:dihydropteroate synthase